MFVAVVVDNGPRMMMMMAQGRKSSYPCSALLLLLIERLPARNLQGTVGVRTLRRSYTSNKGGSIGSCLFDAFAEMFYIPPPPFFVVFQRVFATSQASY